MYKSSCWQAVRFTYIWSICSLPEHKVLITAGFLWPSLMWYWEMFIFLLVANIWNQFVEVERLSLHNKPKPKALCDVHTSLCFNIQFLFYCKLPEAPCSPIANSDQTHRSTNLKSRASPWLLALLSNWLTRLFCVASNIGAKVFIWLKKNYVDMNKIRYYIHSNIAAHRTASFVLRQNYWIFRLSGYRR